jgi:cobalt-zinc-cadmium efflux system membrane fusion protein
LNAAEANLIVAKKNLQATEEMFKSGIISEREYLTAQKEISKINSEMDKIKSTMAIYSGHNSSEYLIKAPMSGYIVEKNMISGMQIREDNAEPVFTIADFNNLWVMINIFETDIDRVREGDIARINTIAYPNKTIEGKIDKIFNVIDPESRTMRARVIVPNKELKLKPGMFAFITIGSSQSSEHLTIASEAVVFKDSKNYVVVVDLNGEQSLRQVELGEVINNRQIVKSGLSVGEHYLLSDNLFVAAKIFEKTQ